MRICVLQALSIAWGRLLADLCHLFSIVFIIDEAMTGMCLSG
jgi:4-aminobutyrate aminotransferase-like enzyme